MNDFLKHFLEEILLNIVGYGFIVTLCVFVYGPIKGASLSIGAYILADIIDYFLNKKKPRRKNKMPNRDGTGPNGKGPGTGKRRGPC